MQGMHLWGQAGRRGTCFPNTNQAEGPWHLPQRRPATICLFPATHPSKHHLPTLRRLKSKHFWGKTRFFVKIPRKLVIFNRVARGKGSVRRGVRCKDDCWITVSLWTTRGTTDSSWALCGAGFDQSLTPFWGRAPITVSLMQLRLSHGKSQSIWQKPTTWQKSECLGFVIGWPLPVYSGKTQGGYKK